MGIRAHVYAQLAGTGPWGSTLDSVDLDKAWHGLHFLLGGMKEGGHLPQHFLLAEESLPGTGDAEVFHYRVAQVRAINDVLQECTPKLLLDRYDGQLMRKLDIYPSIEWDQDDFGYLLDNYKRLQAFVARHAADGHELLVVIC